MKQLLTGMIKFFTRSFHWLGIGAILWLVLRSATKPSRIRYPCQQAAAGTSAFWLSAFVLPGILRGLRAIGLKFPEIQLNRLVRGLLLIGTLSGTTLFLFTRLIVQNSPIVRPVQPDRYFSLPVWVSDHPQASHIFVIDSFPIPDSNAIYHEGLDSLFSLLAQNGIYLYRSTKPLPWCDTTGIIAKNDVVLIKVNAEWPARGMTNTDLIKGLIARIVAHPDTFTGEVQLVENGQWQHSWQYSQNNAERRSQTMQSVVDLFAGQGYCVGAYNWTAIGYYGNNRWVNEFAQGDTVSGYIREDSTGMTYPKFVTSYGTCISTRLGIWNGTDYEPERLKFINMPVLKSHNGMGVTASVKHYIGFLSYAAIGSGVMHQQVMTQGLLGVEFGKARFPDLNIIDATWVSAEITTGPDAPYNMCTRLNTLIASQDPIAADYYAGKYVLRPVSWWNGHPWLHNYDRMDPDNLNNENPGNGHPYSDSTPCHGFPYNAFHQMLVSSRDEMLRYGRQVTMDTTEMTVHLFRFPQVGIEERQSKTRRTIGQFSVALNPTKGTIRITYELARPGPVRLRLLSDDGRLVATLSPGRVSAGKHSLEWNQEIVPGTYFLNLESGEGIRSQKIVIASH